MTRKLVPGRSRLSARTVDRLNEGVRQANGLTSFGPDFSFRRFPGRTTLIPHRHDPVPCYVVHIIEDEEDVPADSAGTPFSSPFPIPYIIGTRATMFAGVWGVFFSPTMPNEEDPKILDPTPFKFFVAGVPYAGYTVEDFKGFLVADFEVMDGPTIEPTDRTVDFLDGGFFRPPTNPASAWAFVITVDNGVWIRHGFLQEGIWRVDPDQEPISATLGPHYTPEHFRFHIADIDNDGVVSSGSIGCRFEGGALVPDFPMLLVAPADVDELCEPCGEGGAPVPLPPATPAEIDQMVRDQVGPGGCVGCG